MKSVSLPAEVILDDLCCDDPNRVAAALQAVSGRGAELIPGLVTRLANVLTHPATTIGEDAPFIGFLCYVAAEFRAVACHSLITEILRLGEQPVDLLLGDVTTGGAGPILADTYGNDPTPLIALIEDKAAGPFERGAGLYALAILVHRELYPRADLLALMVKLAACLDPDREPDCMAANLLVENAVRIHAEEIRGTILGLYERGLAGEDFFESDYTASMLEPDAPPAREARDLDLRIENAWEELRSWHFFSPERVPAEQRSDPPWLPELDPAPEASWNGGDAASAPSLAAIPYRAPPKAGRNDPCPCGSGKKFKKCCGR